jgi:CBS-domain-containing membrane protein
MVVFTKSLFALTAADLMKRPVVSIRDDAYLKDAARLLRAEQISGAPVVNEEGRCVGVLSATDFMRWAETDVATTRVPEPESAYFSDWQVINLERLPHDPVRHHMATDVVTADRSASLAQLARQMLDAHIHRIIIVDACCHPIGIVTSTDILAALAYHEFEAGGS